MNFASFLREDQRLVMLRFYPKCRATAPTVPSFTGADPLWPCPSRDQIKSELRWLEEQGW
jgi:hypothetical protein